MFDKDAVIMTMDTWTISKERALMIIDQMTKQHKNEIKHMTKKHKDEIKHIKMDIKIMDKQIDVHKKLIKSFDNA